MSRWMIALFLTAGLIGLAASPASAQTFTLTAQLNGANETPAALNTGAFGTCTVVVDMRARTITWNVDVFNLPSGVTAAHIHVGADKTPGPTMVNFVVPTNASNDFPISGTATEAGITMRPDQGIRSADDAFQAILGGNTYCNVHSVVNPGGEIRGQLILKQ
jgi:hypothetical protein